MDEGMLVKYIPLIVFTAIIIAMCVFVIYVRRKF